MRGSPGGYRELVLAVTSPPPLSWLGRRTSPAPTSCRVCTRDMGKDPGNFSNLNSSFLVFKTSSICPQCPNSHTSRAEEHALTQVTAQTGSKAGAPQERTLTGAQRWLPKQLEITAS